MKRFRGARGKLSAIADRLVARMFSGEMTEGEAQGIRKWRTESEAHAAAFEASAQAWAQAEALADDSELGALSSDAARTERKAAYLSRLPALPAGLAASALLGIGLALYFAVFRDAGNSALRVYETAVGERAEVALSDGSEVALNTNSRLIVDYSESGRRTILDRGEAFFDVREDRARPFRVELGGKAVTVLGTKFNVRRTLRQGAEISVIEGVVAVHDENEEVADGARLLSVDEIDSGKPSPLRQYRLQEGAVLLIGETNYSVSASREGNSRSRSSWQEGYLRFEGEKLSEVVKEIARYTEKEIIIADGRAKALEVNAVIQLDDIELAFTGIEKALPVDVQIFADNITIIYREDETRP